MYDESPEVHKSSMNPKLILKASGLVSELQQLNRRLMFNKSTFKDALDSVAQELSPS